MKYIVLRKEVVPGTVQDIPILFPNTLVHADVAEVLHRLPELRGAKPVSAGFLSSTALGDMRNAGCHGCSESLGGLQSRGKEDDALFAANDYMHGLVEVDA